MKTQPLPTNFNRIKEIYMFSNSHLATQNKEAVLREYTHAIQDLADRKALNIRTANPDLAVDFDRIDANAEPSV